MTMILFLNIKITHFFIYTHFYLLTNQLFKSNYHTNTRESRGISVNVCLDLKVQSDLKATLKSVNFESPEAKMQFTKRLFIARECFGIDIVLAFHFIFEMNSRIFHWILSFAIGLYFYILIFGYNGILTLFSIS